MKSNACCTWHLHWVNKLLLGFDGFFLLWNILRHWLACRNTASFKLCRTNRNQEFRNVKPMRCSRYFASTNRKRARRTGSQWKAGMAPSLVILHGWSCSCCLCPTPPLKLNYSRTTLMTCACFAEAIMAAEGEEGPRLGTTHPYLGPFVRCFNKQIIHLIYRFTMDSTYKA